MEQKGWNSYHQTKVLLFLSDQAMVMLLLYLRNVRARKHNNTSEQRGEKEYILRNYCVKISKTVADKQYDISTPPPTITDRPVLNNIHC